MPTTKSILLTKNYVASNADKVKQQPLLNTAVEMSLSAIPLIVLNLRDLFNRSKPKKSNDLF
jgi:hypothetical protein